MFRRHALSRVLHLACAAAAAALIAFSATPAHASHYDLADIDIVDKAVVEKLAAIGVDDTKALLERLVTEEGRKDTAAATGMDEAQIADLARHLELMQITGVGPKAARLLVASGVESVQALAKAESATLLEKLIATNAEHQFTGVDPDTEVVEDWIAKAGGVAFKLQ